MTSINPEVCALFDAYREANGIPELPMNMFYEAAIFDSMRMGLTPDMVRTVIVSRRQRKRSGEFGVRGVYFNSIFGQEASAWAIDEYHHLQAKARVRVMDPARQEVLRTTGRSDAVPETPAKASKEVIAKLADEFKRAAE